MGNFSHLIDMLRHLLGDPLSVTAEQLTIPREEYLQMKPF